MFHENNREELSDVCTALVESYSFRVFYELDLLCRQERHGESFKAAKYLMNKLIILKPRDAMELFQKYDVDNDVAMEIASYLY